MTKREKYIKEMSETNFVSGLTTAMYANEIGARVLTELLIEKGIFTYEEWLAAMKRMTERFVDLHVHDYDEHYEPDYLNFKADRE